MLKLSSIAAPGQRLVRTINWTSNTHSNVVLPVTLEYVAPSVLQEEHEQKRTKVIGVRKLTPAEDLSQINDELQRQWQHILADRILKIEGVTLRKLMALMSIDPGKVSADQLDAPVDFDQQDTTALSDDEQKSFPEAKTKGDAARQNILYLLRVHPTFRGFVESVITDVSYFQDEDWESALKN